MRRPIPWGKLTYEEVDEHRFLDCPDYDTCMSQAAQKKWESWTCIFCSFFQDNKQEKKKKGG